MSRLTPVSLLRVLLAVAVVPQAAAMADEPHAAATSRPQGDSPALELPAPPAVPATVSVTVANGRTFTAAIDARTDATTLWLRLEVGSAMLLRGVPWDHVTGAVYQGRSLTPDALRQMVPQLRSGRANVQRPGVRSPSVRARPESGGDAVGRRVRAIQAEAHVAHWGANTEADGIRLSVWPLDEEGRLVAVDGTLDVELIGDRRWHVMPQRPDLREQFSSLGSWTQRLVPQQASRGGPAVFRLPFQTIQPEFDPLVASYGLLIVRLSVAGEGVFETSVSDLRIRPLDNFRDRIERSTGRRYLPQEQTGRPAAAWNLVP